MVEIHHAPEPSPLEESEDPDYAMIGKIPIRQDTQVLQFKPSLPTGPKGRVDEPGYSTVGNTGTKEPTRGNTLLFGHPLKLDEMFDDPKYVCPSANMVAEHLSFTDSPPVCASKRLRVLAPNTDAYSADSMYNAIRAPPIPPMLARPVETDDSYQEGDRPPQLPPPYVPEDMALPVATYNTVCYIPPSQSQDMESSSIYNHLGSHLTTSAAIKNDAQVATAAPDGRNTPSVYSKVIRQGNKNFTTATGQIGNAKKITPVVASPHEVDPELYSVVARKGGEKVTMHMKAAGSHPSSK